MPTLALSTFAREDGVETHAEIVSNAGETKDRGAALLRCRDDEREFRDAVHHVEAVNGAEILQTGVWIWLVQWRATDDGGCECRCEREEVAVMLSCREDE